ncbi:hypothetical protein AGOR_G00058980 [Albula goreensis]|uniref:Calponin-homology (CH) domain-containing protein n=1 Tax=Albula goreensis TaxID=1534307 RepID=A0A8T3DPS4_9TELE|nr:hypothetical protein AGOR_G00058980 [Albula goreensis]
MATLGLDSRPHPQLPSGSLQSNVASLVSHNNVPLNRGLERALEEAANSGFLNLSARKLKEFPRTALTHDLTDTVEADLSKNRLTEVPSEVCHFVSLETLNLYHNCIKTIPDTIISLQTLTSLNLSRNQLSALPACLCGLPLRVLNASNNKLGALPDNIGQLSSLMELDISCNEITALPRHIGRLKALRELNARRNFLCVLPEDLADLPLVKLDVSCNKVSTIPTCFRKMAHLQSLQLENNPLQSPPAQICIKGRVHIFKYLSMEECRSDKMADNLYLPVMDRLLSHQATGSTEDIDQNKKQETDSGVGSDNGDKRLSATEPSDEDSLSLNAPLSHFPEEEGLSKDDSTSHICALTADSPQDCGKAAERERSEELEDRFGSSDSGLSTQFVSYIKGRATDFDEPLRIEEDTSDQPPKVEEAAEIHIDMINQLKEAVELLQDPDRVKMEAADLSGVKLYPAEMVIVEESFSGQDCEDQQTTPKSESSDGSLEFQKKRELILEKARFEAQLACLQFERQVSPQGDMIGHGTKCVDHGDHANGGEDRSSTLSPLLGSPPFGLKPRSAPTSLACSPPPCLRPLTQAPPTDTGWLSSPDEGGMVQSSVFLRTSKSLESMDPQFTMRRKMEQLREELELMEQLRESIESRLKVVLPEDLGSSLMDGVVLCHLVNHIRPRSVASIHVPSPAVPKLSMAKCRRNVENFLDACRKMGVPECSLCSAYDVLQSDLRPIRNTILALVAFEADKEGEANQGVAEGVGGVEGQVGGVVESVGETEAVAEDVDVTEEVVKCESVKEKPAQRSPSPSWCFWDLIGSSIVHLLCLILLFAAYSWSELT